jgi:hypothetical protein
VELERQLSQNQRDRLARAYRQAGAEAVEGFRKCLLGVINEEDRRKVGRPVTAREPQRGE